MAPLDTTIRQPDAPEAPPAQPWVGYAEDAPPLEGSTIVETDDDGNVTVKTVGKETPKRSASGFDENLADLPELEPHLALIAQDIIEGVDADIQSRQLFIDNYTRGLSLLGLTIENQDRTKGQRRKTSTVRDSTLLESVVKAQAQARGELLPAAGPAKVQTVPETDEATEQRAADFEADLNLALTKGMPEYVPDLDRGLFGLFYGGNMFRYGYQCPIKGRPRVDTVSVDDLIVSEEATALDTATRWTIRIPEMAPGEVRRRQHYKVWRQCDLGAPMPDTDASKQKLSQIAGVTSLAQRPQDQPYTIYQTVTDLDLTMHGVEEKGAPDGLPLPYRVTVEKHSRQILRIERYWTEGDKKFNRKRRCVHYPMVPGFGFLAYGFLHLQGNQVVTLTAVIRLLIDAMMFGSFPGGVKAKGLRTETNEIEPGPGEWPEIGIPAGMDDIRKVLMALPYKDLSPVSIQLYEMVQQACARVGAAASLEVGEGRANVPVGTIMAMLEEKSVVMSAIHKRLHEAMGQELTMIRELFAERPETLAEVLPNPRRAWSAAEEFADLNLVPSSDPNIPSQTHRIMLATALATLCTMPVFAPRLDIDDILKDVLRMIGVASPENRVIQPQQGADPQAVTAQAALTAKKLDLESKAQDRIQKQQESQRKAAHEVVESQQQERSDTRDAMLEREKIDSAEKIAHMREQTELMRMGVEEQRARREHAHEVVSSEADREDRRFGGKGL
jgi:hypothetical protein